jgi:hypothetical protein
VKRTNAQIARNHMNEDKTEEWPKQSLPGLHTQRFVAVAARERRALSGSCDSPFDIDGCLGQPPAYVDFWTPED